MEIVSDSIASAWERSIFAILEDSSKLEFTQRGERAKEILAVQMVVKNPLGEEQISRYYPFGDIFVEDYCKNILDASYGNHSISSRMMRKAQLDRPQNNQVQKVINLLRKSPNTRRAVISLWDPEKDLNAKHPPCACTIQFLVRNQHLDTIAYFRSNDSWLAALPDMIAITRLSSTVSNKTNIPIGQYIHFAASYHLYEPDIIPAQIAFARRNNE